MKLDYFKNKVAIVSGSSMGIGKAIAIELASKGVSVLLNGIEAEQLFKTETELRAKGFLVSAVVADIRDPKACKYLVDECIKAYGSLDILINNAGVSSRGSVEHMADGNFSILAETNFMGSAYLSKYAIAHLKATKGHIIFMNSAGGFRGMPYNSAYSSTKVAQAALADALRIELYDYGIHVGVTFVGFTENDPEKKVLDVDGSWVYLPKRKNIKLAKPQDVAKSIALMIVNRTANTTLTRLGLLANFTTRYLPSMSNWILRMKRAEIQKDFTLIGGEKTKMPAQVKESQRAPTV
tara:strand:+ start:7452 stop:8336 length:885 start_codon:yes stop_codon:yes gene_type:complete